MTKQAEERAKLAELRAEPMPELAALVAHGLDKGISVFSAGKLDIGKSRQELDPLALTMQARVQCTLPRGQ